MTGAIDPFFAALIVRMASAMALVVAASLFVERSGPFLGAMVATLPLSAGPSYVFIAMDHDAAFVAQSALSTLNTNVGTGAFAAVYALLAARVGLAGALAGAYAAWGSIVLLLVGGGAGPATAVAANVLVYWVGIRATRLERGAPRPARRPRRWWEIPIRAVGVMVLVAVVVVVGHRLGPEAAGVAAAFPIIMTSLILILHTSVGGAASAATLAHALPGMVGFGFAALALHLTAQPLGSAIALCIALGVCLAWNGMLVSAVRRRVRTTDQAGAV